MSRGEGSSKEPSKERVDRLVREGRLSQEMVDGAVSFWQARLTGEISLPNGERVFVTLGDLYHIIVAPRILRKPWRIERILVNAVEIRTGDLDRRKVASRWDEDGRLLVGYFVLDTDNSVRTMHVVDEKRIRKLMKDGDLLWKQ